MKSRRSSRIGIAECDRISVRVASGYGTERLRLGAGAFHACGIDAAGTVTCWGDNLYGQLNVP
jgi:hypothetical protein